MRQNKTIYWQVTQQTPTLKHLCRSTLQHGAHYLHIAGEGMQPVVLVPLHHWRELRHRARGKHNKQM